MKKALSVILALIMVLSLSTVFVSAAAVPNYDTAKDGDVLYTVDFSGTDGIYAPINFRNGAAKMAATKIEVKDDGKTLFAQAPADAGSAYFYGSQIKGLTIGEGKQYTITFTATFPSGNVGFYFNGAEWSKDAEPTSDISYNGLYGIYGKLTESASFTLSKAAGGKITGDLVSLSSGYTKSPVVVANDTEANVRFEIDGTFYSVFINDVLYDHVDMKDEAKANQPYLGNLGFVVYLYNKNAKTTVSNVVVKKGCTYTKAAAEVANPGKTYKGEAASTLTTIDYNAAKNGTKLTDLLFNSTTGAFQPVEISKNAANTMDISADGKTYTSTIAGTAAAEWYGGKIGNLKITDSTKYTFKYKVKTVSTGTTYTLGIAFNSAERLGSGYRMNWYGQFTPSDAEFTINDAKVKTAMKFAYNGTYVPGYNYTDEAMKVFTTYAPKLDAEGFADIAVELDGWTWTFYCVAENGQYEKVQTVDVKSILNDRFMVSEENMNDLCFQIYTYNKSISASVKDAELYKGTILSVDYSKEVEPETPVTGDNMTVYACVAVVALVSVLGMAWVAKKEN